MWPLEDPLIADHPFCPPDPDRPLEGLCLERLCRQVHGHRCHHRYWLEEARVGYEAWLRGEWALCYPSVIG